MNPEQAAELIWHEARAGRWFPPALHGQLTLDEALRAQLGVRDRKTAAGTRQAGWKVGLTSQRVRKRYGIDARPFGHIMEPDVYKAGASIATSATSAFRNASIEPELCFTIGARLAGPGVTPAQARAAVAAVSAGFELNQNRAGSVKDFPLSVADNLSQWGIVVGDTLAPLPAGLELSTLQVELRRDGEPVASAVGAPETIDDHFLSLSILANLLGEHGQALEPGQLVITGSFAKEDVAAGETWEARFSGIGAVSVRFT